MIQAYSPLAHISPDPPLVSDWAHIPLCQVWTTLHSVDLLFHKGCVRPTEAKLAESKTDPRLIAGGGEWRNGEMHDM